MAKGLYLIPLLFAFTPFLSGDIFASLEIFVFAAAGLYAMAGGVSGYLESRLNPIERVLSLACGVVLFWPLAWFWHLSAFAVFITVFSLSRRRANRAAIPAVDRESARSKRPSANSIA